MISKRNSSDSRLQDLIPELDVNAVGIALAGGKKRTLEKQRTIYGWKLNKEETHVPTPGWI
jgi:hypothetical protein